MNLVGLLNRSKQSFSEFWAVRDARERAMLSAAAAVVLLGLIYALLIDPALTGREQLHKNLPELRQQVAQLQALSKEAAALSGKPAAPPIAMAMAISKENIEAALARNGLKPQSVGAKPSMSTSANSIPRSRSYPTPYRCRRSFAACRWRWASHCSQVSACWELWAHYATVATPAACANTGKAGLSWLHFAPSFFHSCCKSAPMLKVANLRKTYWSFLLLLQAVRWGCRSVRWSPTMTPPKSKASPRNAVGYRKEMTALEINAAMCAMLGFVRAERHEAPPSAAITTHVSHFALREG